MLCSIPLLILFGLGAALLGGLIAWLALRPKMSSLEEDLDRRNLQLKKSTSDYETLNSKNQYLQKQLRELETAHHELSTSMRNWQDNNGELEVANSKLKEDYNLLKQEYSLQVEEITANHGRLRDDYEKLRLILEDKDATILTLQEQVESTHSTSNNQLQQSTTELHSLRTSYEALLEEHKQYASLIDSLKQENNTVQGTFNQLKSNADDQLTIANQQLSELKTLNLALTQERDAAKDELARMSDSVEELEKSLHGNSSGWEARYQNLADQYELAQKRLEELQNDRDSALERLSLLDGEYGKSIAEWGSKYEHLKEQLYLANQQIDSYGATNGMEENRLKLADAQHAQTISDWEDKYQTLLAQLEAARQQNSEWQNKCAALAEEVAQANYKTNELEAAKTNSVVELEHKYSLLLDELHELKTNSNTIESEKNQAVERLHFLDSENSRNLSEWEDKYHSLLDQFNSANLRIGELTQQHAELVEQMQTEQGNNNVSLAEWESKYNHLLDQFNLVNHRIKAVEAEKNQAFEQLHLSAGPQDQNAGEWEAKYHQLNEQYNQVHLRMGALEQGKELLLARFAEMEAEKEDVAQKLVEESNQTVRLLQQSSKDQSDTVAAWEARYNELLIQFNQTMDQSVLLEQEKQALSEQLSRMEHDRTTGLSNWESRYRELLQQFEEQNGRVAELEHETHQSLARINELEDNNNRIINTWEAKYDHLLEQFEQTNRNLTSLEAEREQLSQSAQEAEQVRLNLVPDIENQLDTTRSDYAALSAEFTTYKDSIDKEFSDLQSRLATLNTQMEQLNSENTSLRTELTDQTQTVDEYRSYISTLEASRDKLQEDIETFQTRHFAEMDEVVSDADSYKTKFENLLEAQRNSSILIAEIEKQRDQLAADYNKLNSLYLNLSQEEGSYKDKYEALAARQKNFESIIADLETQLSKFREGKRLLRNTFSVEPEDVILDRIAQNAAQINFERIGYASEADAEDLERIKGIGSFTVKKLNRLGIFKFAQLINLTPDDISIVNEAIEYFPGRIEREDWVGQARLILGMVEEDDLKVIEGIGPAIESLLKENGIQTWAQLSVAGTEQIKEILAAKGNQFSLHEPTTWPAQAQLAADGKWEELSKWQSELKGGFEV